jgi:hypothetical protein
MEKGKKGKKRKKENKKKKTRKRKKRKSLVKKNMIKIPHSIEKDVIP